MAPNIGSVIRKINFHKSIPPPPWVVHWNTPLLFHHETGGAVVVFVGSVWYWYNTFQDALSSKYLLGCKSPQISIPGSNLNVIWKRNSVNKDGDSYHCLMHNTNQVAWFVYIEYKTLISMFSWVKQNIYSFNSLVENF